MFRNLALGLVACVMVVGCKSKQTQSDQSVDNMGGGATLDTAPLSYDPMGSDSGKIAGLNTVYFGYDKSSLDSAAKSDIQGNAEWMKANPAVRIQIEGHCDSRGTIEYNVALGERRANAVKAYMVSQGIAADRLSVISYGKEKPIEMGDSEAAWGRNRRANFVPAQ